MFKPPFEAVAALFFAKECEACSVILSPSAEGLCPACESQIQWIAGPHCPRCGRTSVGDVCGRCENEPFHFDRAFACAYYEGPFKKLLHSYKFAGRKALKNYLLRMMNRFADAYIAQTPFEAVLAVPLDKDKEKQRGFNQARLLSSGLARKMRLPEATRKVRRAPSRAPQALLDRATRKLNVKDRFSVKDTAFFASKNVLLVDDILTTGHTASECARALKAAGASSVTVLACARGL